MKIYRRHGSDHHYNNNDNIVTKRFKFMDLTCVFFTLQKFRHLPTLKKRGEKYQKVLEKILPTNTIHQGGSSR